MDDLSPQRQESAPPPATLARQELIRQIGRAHAEGLVTGRAVCLGSVNGTIIGYNIAEQGLYYASRYPLLVETAFGTIKCRIEEVKLV